MSTPNAKIPRPFPRLLADVGGTNARFAWQAAPGAPIGDGRVLPCAKHPTLQAAMHAYLGGLNQGAPQAAAPMAPGWRATSRPFTNSVSVGMFRML